MLKIDLLNSPGIQKNISKKSVGETQNKEKINLEPSISNKKSNNFFGFMASTKFKEVMISIFLISVLAVGYYFNEKIVGKTSASEYENFIQDIVSLIRLSDNNLSVQSCDFKRNEVELFINIDKIDRLKNINLTSGDNKFYITKIYGDTLNNYLVQVNYPRSRKLKKQLVDLDFESFLMQAKTNRGFDVQMKDGGILFSGYQEDIIDLFLQIHELGRISFIPTQRNKFYQIFYYY